MRGRRFWKFRKLWDGLFELAWAPSRFFRSLRTRRFPALVRLRALPLELVRMEERVVPDGRPLPLPFIFVGAAVGAPPVVKAYHADTGELAFEKQPFDSGFTGGVRVAAGDINNDGTPDLIAAAGPGAGPHVVVYDGVTGNLLPGALGSFYAYGSGFTGGVYVASGDVDGDGWADIITSAGAGAGPHVKVFSGRTGETIASFYAFAPSFAGGATIAAADFTGDGKADLVVGAGPGAGPHVKIFDISTGNTIDGPLGSFYAFDPSISAGVDVGAGYLAGDVTGDGKPDLVVGLGAGVGSDVRVFNGFTGALVSEFSPFGSDMKAGVRVASAYINDDIFADIVVGTGEGVPAQVKVFDGHTLEELPAPMSSYSPFGSSYTGGLFVGASNDPDLGGDPPPPPPLTPYVWITGDQDGSETDGSDTGRGWFIVHRSGGTGTLVVNYGTPTGTATVTTDYTGPGASGGSVTFSGSDTIEYLYVSPVDDTLVEGTETVGITLTSGSGYSVSGSGATINIFDNDTYGAIGDYVWKDYNANGVADTGEPAAPGIAVTLTGGTISATSTTTDSAGHYSFTGLSAGTYTVSFAGPPGTSFRTPFGGVETVTLTSGETDNSVDAGVVYPPTLLGQALIAVQGKDYNGVVATVAGTTWHTGDLGASIEWGDGTETAGTLVSVSGTLEVMGDHTYTLAGDYALAVRVEVLDTDSSGATLGVTALPVSTPAIGYAAGLAMVLAPTDHADLEKVNSAVATGGGTLVETTSIDSGGNWTATTGGTFAYSLTESVDAPADSYSLTRSGTFGFTLREVGTDFPQPNSTLSLSASETSTRTETDAAPTLHGSASVLGSDAYTLSQTGTGADYTWTKSDSATSTRTETETTEVGTFAAVGTTTSARSIVGRSNAVGGVYSDTWSGTQATVWNESGYRGPDSYTLTQTDTGAGTIWGTETGNFWTDGFTLTQADGNAYTLTESTTNAGGGSTRTASGSYTDGLSGSGVDPYGTAAFSATRTTGFTGSSTSTLAGITTSAAESGTLSTLVASSGSETAGSFTVVASSGSTSTSTPSTNDQGDLITQTVVESATTGSTETGTLGTGTYTLSGTDRRTTTTTGSDANQGVPSSWTDTVTDVGSSTRNGDRLAGGYTLSGTDTVSSSGNHGSRRNITETAADGTAGRHSRASTEIDSGSDTATYLQTGNLITGSYSLHETGSSATTSSPTLTEDIAANASGDANDDTTTDISSDTAGDSYTLDRTGNHLSGSYSLRETSSWSDGGADSSTDIATEGFADSKWARDLTGSSSTSNSNGTTTATETGNELAGSYGRTETDVSSSTTREADTGGDTLHAADGSSEVDASGATATLIQTATTTFTKTGNSVSGVYSLNETDTTVLTTIRSGSDGATSTEADGLTNWDSNTDGGTSTDTRIAAFTDVGNAITGDSTRNEIDMTSGGGNGSDGGSDTGTGVDGESDGGSSGETQTNAETSSETVWQHGNSTTGLYTRSATGFDVSTFLRNAAAAMTQTEGTGDRDADRSTDTVTTTSSSNYTTYETGDWITETATKTGASSNTTTNVSHDHGFETLTGADGSTDIVERWVDGTDTLADSNAYTLVEGYFSGDYTETSTDGTTVTATATTVEDHAISGADGSTQDNASSHTVGSSSTDTTGLVETGNRVEGVSGTTRTSGGTSSSRDIATGDGTLWAADGSIATDTYGNTTTAYASHSNSGSSTADDTTGLYTLVESFGDTSTAFSFQVDDYALLSADGSVKYDLATTTSTDSNTGSSTSTDISSDTSGLASHDLHSTGGSTLSQSSSDRTTYLNADLSSSTVLSADSTTNIDARSSSIGETDDLESGLYARTSSNGTGATVYGTHTDSATYLKTDGGSGTDANTSTATAVESATASTAGNGSNTTGAYSLSETSGNTKSSSSRTTRLNGSTAASGSTDSNQSTVVASDSNTHTATAVRTGNDVSGANTVTERSTDTASSGHSDTYLDTYDGISGAVSNDQSTLTSGTTGGGTHTLTQIGSDATGSYSLADTSTNSSTTTTQNTDTQSYIGADGSVQIDRSGSSSTDVNAGTDHSNRSGNSATGVYSTASGSTSTWNNSGTDTTQTTLTAADGSTDNKSSTTTNAGGDVTNSTSTSSGNNSTGTYGNTDSSGHTWTSQQGTNESDTRVQASGAVSVDGTSQGSTTTGNDTSSTVRSGNSSTGVYTLTTTSGDGSTSTVNTSFSDHYTGADGAVDGTSGSNTSTTTSTGNSTQAESGNDAIGTYSLSSTWGNSTTTRLTGSDTDTLVEASGAGDINTAGFTETSTQGSSGSSSRDGNESLGNYTLTSSGGSTTGSSRTDITSDTQTLASGNIDKSRSTIISGYSDVSGSTSSERGNNATGSYSLTESSGHTWSNQDGSSDTDTYTWVSGAVAADGSSHASTTTGTDTSSTVKTGNYATGAYTVTATNTDGSTTTGTDSYLDHYTGSNGALDGTSGSSTSTTSQTGTSTTSATGNDEVGNYSSSESGGSTTASRSTGTDGETRTETSGAVDVASVGYTKTSTDSSTNSSSRSGNDSIGTYTLTSASGSTTGWSNTDTTDDTKTEASGNVYVSHVADTSGSSDVSTATSSASGNNATGTYTNHATTGHVWSSNQGSTESGTLTEVSGAVKVDGETSGSTTTGTDSTTKDSSGNDAVGNYALTETSSNGSTTTVTDSTTDDLTAADGSTDDSSATISAVDSQTSSSTTTESGNVETGAYSTGTSGSNTSTAIQSSSDTSTLTAAGGWENTADTSRASTTIRTGTESGGKSGNSSTGDYTLTESRGSTLSVQSVDTDQGLASTTGTTATDSTTTTEMGNDETGLYTLTAISTDGSGSTSHGSDARGTFTATASAAGTSTTTNIGDDGAGLSTVSVVSSATSTVTTIGGDGTRSFTDTNVSSDSSSEGTTADAMTGDSTRTLTLTHNSTASETGSNGSTGHAWTEIDGSTHSESEQYNAETGADTLTVADDASTSLHETGSQGSGGNYTLDKSATTTLDAVKTGNADDGEYLLTGTTGTLSTAIETTSGGSLNSAFTEILGENGSIVETGDDATGEYDRTLTGTRTANFRDAGTNAGGSFNVTETSNGTFTQTKEGDVGIGEYLLHESNSTTYGMTETMGSGAVTLISSGVDDASVTETGNIVTGAYSRGETGTDEYQLIETGTSFGETVTGTDNYSVAETGNNQKQIDSRTTIGGGAWTRTSTGAAALASGSGTDGYTLSETGDAAAGQFGQSETGSDRYALVDRFDDVSNTGTGETPGNVTFHSHGLAFRDPAPIQPKDKNGIYVDTYDKAFWESAANGADKITWRETKVWIEIGGKMQWKTMWQMTVDPAAHDDIVGRLRTDKTSDEKEIQKIMLYLYGDRGNPNPRPLQASTVDFNSVTPSGVTTNTIPADNIAVPLNLQIFNQNEAPGATLRLKSPRTLDDLTIQEQANLQPDDPLFWDPKRQGKFNQSYDPKDPLAFFKQFEPKISTSSTVKGTPANKPPVKYGSPYEDLADFSGGIADVFNTPHSLIDKLPIGQMGTDTLHNLYSITEPGKMGLQAQLWEIAARRKALDEQLPSTARSKETVIDEVTKDIPTTMNRAYVVTLDGMTFNQIDSLHEDAERIKKLEPGLYEISDISGKVATVAVVLIIGAEVAAVGGLTMLSTGEVVVVSATGVSIRGVVQDGRLSAQYLKGTTLFSKAPNTLATPTPLNTGNRPLRPVPDDIGLRELIYPKDINGASRPVVRGLEVLTRRPGQGPLAMTTPNKMDELSKSEGPTVDVYTRLSGPPTADREIHLSLESRALSDNLPNTTATHVYHGKVPKVLIEELERAGLASRSTTLMGKVVGTELEVYSPGTEWIVPFLKKIP